MNADYSPSGVAKYMVKDLSFATAVAEATDTHPILLPAERSPASWSSGDSATTTFQWQGGSSPSAELRASVLCVRCGYLRSDRAQPASCLADSRRSAVNLDRERIHCQHPRPVANEPELVGIGAGGGIDGRRGRTGEGAQAMEFRRTFDGAVAGSCRDWGPASGWWPFPECAVRRARPLDPGRTCCRRRRSVPSASKIRVRTACVGADSGSRRTRRRTPTGRRPRLPASPWHHATRPGSRAGRSPEGRRSRR